MNHGTTASLLCPACGQAFLSMQHAMESMTQCPHCAHTAPRGQFGTQAQVAGVPQVRRRTSHQPAVAAVQPPLPEAMPAAVAPAVQPAAHWQAPTPFQQPQPHPAAAPPQTAPLPPMVRHPLQPSQALMPVHAPPPPGDFATPRQLQPQRGRAGLMALAVAAVAGIGGWMWWDHTRPNPTVSSTNDGLPPRDTAEPVAEVRRAQVALPAPAPEPKVELEDTQAYSADAKTLVTTLFGATTAEARQECIHEGGKHQVEIEALLGPEAARKPELRQLAMLPSVILSLPGGRHVPLFKLVTTACPSGALLRLETGPDGKRRIFWPLLQETHEGRLPAYLRQAETDAAWFYVALRPSHGLDLPSAQRSKYLTFDVQSSAAAEPHIVACVDRDTPLARFMDGASDWGRVYVARLLVKKLDLQTETPCMVVVACEEAVAQ